MSKSNERNWTVGANQPAPFDSPDFISVTPPDDGRGLYALMISAVVPRPIALVSSLNKQGVGNLAPFSYFTIISHHPPTVMFSIIRDPSKADQGFDKDTLANIKETGEYVVHIMNEWYLDAANHCSGNFASDTNEQSVAGLTPTASKVVKPPRIQESAFHMECKLVDTYEVPDRKSGQVNATMVIGEVVMFHVKKEVASESPSGSLVVDITKGYKPMSRLGGNMYGTVGDIVDIPRPKV